MIINEKKPLLTKNIFGKPINLTAVNSTEKIYNTELLLLSNSENFANLIFWVKYHLDTIKFEHLILIYNNTQENFNKLKEIFADNDKIDLYCVTGSVSQANLYNFYIKNSKSKWVLPMDDDEYLYIPEKYNHDINEVLKVNNTYYKYSFNWLSCISKAVYDEVDEETPYYKLYNYCLPLDHDENNTIKTIINTSICHNYIENREPLICMNNILKVTGNTLYAGYNNMGSVHNPISHDGITYQHALSLSDNKSIIIARVIPEVLKNISEDNCYIFHFKYRSYNEWKNKCKNMILKDIDSTFCRKHYVDRKYFNIYKANPESLIDISSLFTIFENLT